MGQRNRGPWTSERPYHAEHRQACASQSLTEGILEGILEGLVAKIGQIFREQ
jgi:hypothetical protein